MIYDSNRHSNRQSNERLFATDHLHSSRARRRKQRSQRAIEIHGVIVRNEDKPAASQQTHSPTVRIHTRWKHAAVSKRQISGLLSAIWGPGSGVTSPRCCCVSVLDKWKEANKNAYFSPQVLIGHYNHVGWISDSCGSPSDVGEDYFCNQDMSGVQIKHLAQPANQTGTNQKSPLASIRL